MNPTTVITRGCIPSGRTIGIAVEKKGKSRIHLQLQIHRMFRAATVRERAQFVGKKSARLLTRAALNPAALRKDQVIYSHLPGLSRADKSVPVSLPDMKNEGSVSPDSLCAGLGLEPPARFSIGPNFNASPGQVATQDGCFRCSSLSRQKLHFCIKPLRPY